MNLRDITRNFIINVKVLEEQLNESRAKELKEEK